MGTSPAAKEKTVNDILGDAFNYNVNLYKTDYTFCKKFLTFCCSEFSTENLLFVLVCTKYVESGAPSWVAFNTIYNEFLTIKSARQVNISSAQTSAIKAVADRNAEGFSERDISNLLIFTGAVEEIKELISKDTLMRLKSSIHAKIFLLDDSKKKEIFNDAISCLKSYDINLAGV